MKFDDLQIQNVYKSRYNNKNNLINPQYQSPRAASTPNPS